MLNYQKFHFSHYYVMDTNGMTAPCTRCECFAAPDDLPGCPYKQRWLYDAEAGYAVRLPRTKLGDDLGRFNQAFLKKEERYRDHRSAQVSIDQPRFNDDGDEVGGMDFADPNVDIEGRFIEQDSYRRLTELLSQLKEADRQLIKFLRAKTPKQQVADFFGITLDGVYYREKQLKKRIKSLPGFDGRDYLE